MGAVQPIMLRQMYLMIAKLYGPQRAEKYRYWLATMSSIAKPPRYTQVSVAVVMRVRSHFSSSHFSSSHFDLRGNLHNTLLVNHHIFEYVIGSTRAQYAVMLICPE